MKSIKLLPAIVVIFLFPLAAYTQNVAINNDGSDPDPSAMLDVQSENRGLLVPRIEFANRPANPATGLLIFQVDNTPGFYYFDGSTWIKIADFTQADWEQTNSAAADFIKNKPQYLSDFIDDVGYLTYEKDSLVTNEIQTLSRNGQTISLSRNGGSFTDEVDDNDWAISGDDIYLAQNGNVGIGTNEPHRKLEVVGNLGEDANGVEFKHSNKTQGIGIGYNTIYACGTNFNQNLNLKPHGTGKVGINRTDPDYTLDVNGSFRVTYQALIDRYLKVHDSLRVGEDLYVNLDAHIGDDIIAEGYIEGKRFISEGTGNTNAVNVRNDSENYPTIYAKNLDTLGRVLNVTNDTRGEWAGYIGCSYNDGKGLYVKGDFYSSGSNGKMLDIGKDEYLKTSFAMSLKEEVQYSGSSNLENGRARINLPEVLTRNTDRSYKVIITPTGNCNGIFVSTKNKQSFTVSELMHGTSNASFDWLVIVSPANQSKNIGTVVQERDLPQSLEIDQTSDN